MRVFVGLELPDSIRQAAANQIDALRARVEKAAPRAVIRWVQPANLHLTIWFIGEVSDTRITEIWAALGHPYRTPSFGLQFRGIGAFPTPARPRVMWMPVARGADGLAALYDEVRHRLEPLGFEPERREYAAHLTLARIKDTGRVEGAAWHRILSAPAAPLEAFDVTAVTLFRSRLSPKGAQYESLLRVPLR